MATVNEDAIAAEVVRGWLNRERMKPGAPLAPEVIEAIERLIADLEGR